MGSSRSRHTKRKRQGLTKSAAKKDPKPPAAKAEAPAAPPLPAIIDFDELQLVAATGAYRAVIEMTENKCFPYGQAKAFLERFPGVSKRKRKRPLRTKRRRTAVLLWKQQQPPRKMTTSCMNATSRRRNESAKKADSPRRNCKRKPMSRNDTNKHEWIFQPE